MRVVETIGRIRREHFVQGKSIKEIDRDLRLSRNTVRKVLRSDETSFSYERQVRPRPKLGRWKEQLDRPLAANVEAPARERLTLIRIFEELRALGYDGGYDAMRRYARSFSEGECNRDGGCLCAADVRAGRGLSIRLEPRDRCDGRVTTIVKVAHLRLCHSRMMLCASIRGRPRRWCLTPTTGRSPSSKALVGAASSRRAIAFRRPSAGRRRRTTFRQHKGRS